jgi:Tfp pilus assembly PilM family ATPase
VARYLAIDWDHNQLYVVLGNVRGGKVTLERAASWAEQKSPGPGDGPLLGKLLRERLKAAGIPAAPILACLGRDRVNLKEVRYPASVSDADEPALVRFRAESELNRPSSEVVFDYVPAGPVGNDEKRALVMVAPREILHSYQDLSQSAGLKLEGLTPRTFGLAAAGRRAMAAALLAPESGDAAFAVVAVTDRWAEFVIVHGATVLMSRMLNVGAGMAREVQRNLAVYAGQSPAARVRAVFLTGIDVEPLKDNLGAVLGMPVHLFEPFGGAESAGLPDVNRGAYVAAAGLLLAQAEGALPLNFVRVKQTVVAPTPTRQYILAAVAVLMFLVLGAFGCKLYIERGRPSTFTLFGHTWYTGTNARVAEINQDRENAEKDFKDKVEANKRIKAMDDWDGLSQADEFYDLTWRIVDVNKLPLTKITVTHVRELRPTETKKTTNTPAGDKKKEYVDLYVLEGTLVDKNREPLDSLADRYRKDQGYLVEPPEIKGNKFTLRVYAERRPPGAYVNKLPPVLQPKVPGPGQRPGRGPAVPDDFPD